MKISERQVMQLIAIAENMRMLKFEEGDLEPYIQITELLAEITMQQSKQLKEIE